MGERGTFALRRAAWAATIFRPYPMRLSFLYRCTETRHCKSPGHKRLQVFASRNRNLFNNPARRASLIYGLMTKSRRVPARPERQAGGQAQIKDQKSEIIDSGGLPWPVKRALPSAGAELCETKPTLEGRNTECGVRNEGWESAVAGRAKQSQFAGRRREAGWLAKQSQLGRSLMPSPL